MPELPEVETIKLGLEKRIVGLTLKDVEVLNPKSFLGNPKIIEGKKVIDVWRRGKVLGINLLPAGPVDQQPHPTSSLIKLRLRALDGTPRLSPPAELNILFHLKMSGQLIWEKGGKDGFSGGHPNREMQSIMPVKSTRVIFTFSDGSKLYFNDQRKFGWVRIENQEYRIKNEGFLSKMGPEPLQPEFTQEIFKKNLLKHKNSPIKSVILDQSVVAGVGNIYACEALFLAHIDPRRKVLSLSDKEVEDLHLAIQKALKLGIEHGGSTRSHFVNVEGKKGSYLDFANVYNRQGKACKVCKVPIEKIKLSGRGTYFCPNCQKSDR